LRGRDGFRRFFRGVNVGGHNAFQPSAFARELARFDVVNIGAAGTFLVRKLVGQAALRTVLRRRLPFEADAMICRARDVLELVASESFTDVPDAKDLKRYVTVLAKRRVILPPLPLSQPGGKAWQVKLIAVLGRFALSVRRRMGRTFAYPNEVVEKKLGVAATTRNWNTISAVSRVLQGACR
jgi:uncharacterized protein (DUF1697 family)